jgi:hypothetical protein
MTTVANWYHAQQDSVKRSEGKSAVGLIAYITGETLKDERTGTWCSRNHPGEVLAWDTVAPDWAPDHLVNDAHLSKTWNDVERSETRKNSIVAVHWNVAASREFSEDDHRDVAREIAAQIMQRYGVMVTYGIHKPTDHGDDRNWHYHFGHNMRRVTTDGFGEKAREIIDKKTFVDETIKIRAIIADALNQKLAQIGSEERVTHLSYAERGIVREPTKHLGNKQNQAELKGQSTPTGNENRAIRERNAKYDQEQEQNLTEARQLHHEAQIIDLLAERLKRINTEIGMSDQPDEKRRKEADYQLADQHTRYRIEEDQVLRAEGQLRAEKAISDQAIKDREKLEAEAKQRIDAGDITDAKARYAQAATQFDIRRPYSSLCDVATAENAAYHRGQDDLAARAAEEKDPLKRQSILLHKGIEHADYMAITSERLAGISYVITGRRDKDSQYQKDIDSARDWRAEGKALREERRDVQKEMDERGRDDLHKELRNLERGVYSGNVKNPSRQQFSGSRSRRDSETGEAERKDTAFGLTQDHHTNAPPRDRSAAENRERGGQSYDPATGKAGSWEASQPHRGTNEATADDGREQSAKQVEINGRKVEVRDEGKESREERTDAKHEVSDAMAERAARHAAMREAHKEADDRAYNPARSRGGNSR